MSCAVNVDARSSVETGAAACCFNQSSHHPKERWFIVVPTGLTVMLEVNTYAYLTVLAG